MKPMSHICVYGLNESVRASKYPMSVDIDSLTDEITKTTRNLGNAPAGSGHDNFLNGIIVQFDLTFSVKVWVEEERYHFIDFISSQSTMHRITKFNVRKQYVEHVDPIAIELMENKIAVYNRMKEDDADKKLLDKQLLSILYTNPCGFRLTARMTTNYRQLKTIYHQRRAHFLPEWRAMCRQIESLPEFKTLCLGGKHENS